MDITNILSIIDTLQEEEYSGPINYYQKKERFIYQSYAKSAINEIKTYLKKYNKENVMDVLEDFRYQMDCFACESRNSDANFMFSVYYDVVTDVIDTLLTMK